MRKPWFAKAAALGLGLTAPATAAAQQQGADVVVLKDGGMLRGTVAASEPGKEVTIFVLGSSVPRTVPWSAVDHVERAPAQPAASFPPPGQLPAASPAAPPPLEPGPGAPRLHIVSSGPDITLFEVAGEVAVSDSEGTSMRAMNRPVCVSPCDRVIDGRRGQSFYFGGPRVPESQWFLLANASGTIEARVDAGSTRAQAAGVGLVAGGIGPLLAGAIVAGVSRAYTAPVFGDQAKQMLIGGAAAAGLGAVMILAGVAVWRAAGRTTYDVTPSSSATGRSNGSPLRPSFTASGVALRF